MKFIKQTLNQWHHKIWMRLLSSIEGYLFSSRCFYCHKQTKQRQPLCESCLYFLHFNTPPSRRSLFLKTFNAPTPIAPLISMFQKGELPFMAKGIAGYMALYYLQLDLSFPDYIVPVPLVFKESLRYKSFPNQLLAKSLGNIFRRPICGCLKWKTTADLEKRRPKSLRLSIDEKFLKFLKGKTLLIVSTLHLNRQFHEFHHVYHKEMTLVFLSALQDHE